jgi:elongator complex protein 3
LKGDIALIRELHVYGPELEIGVRDGDSAQHRGYGRRLVFEAERIAREEIGTSFIAVLSGVGARVYYRELGYALNSGYMVKCLETKPLVTALSIDKRLDLS